MNSALQLTEIVGCILEYVGLACDGGRKHFSEHMRARRLKHCLMVNKLWFHESARLIWKSVKIRNLRKIRGLKRQQVYANFVTSLDSPYPSRYTIRSQLKFPVLQTVNICNSKASEESLYPLLVPSLSYLWLEGVDISDQFLLDVIERCPELHDFTLYGSPKLTTAGLQKFLIGTRCSRLVLRSMSECFGWETLCKAAENKFIKELVMPGCDEYAFSQVRKLVKHPFPSLNDLCCTVEGSIENLLRLTKTLKRVSLVVHDLNTAIRCFKRPECSIEELYITAHSGYLDKNLIELAKYSNLKSVRLWMYEHTSVATQVVDDKWVDEFTRFTPSLTSFRLCEFPIEVTSKGISAIGRNCPDITDVDLWNGGLESISVDKNDFSMDLPRRFPKLEQCTIDYYCFFVYLGSERINWHFPIVSLWHEDSSGEMVAIRCNP